MLLSMNLCAKGRLGNAEPLKKEMKTRSLALFPLLKEKTGTAHRNISVYKTLTGLFHNSNVFWTSASQLLPPMLGKMKWDSDSKSPNSVGPSLTQLQSKYFPCATGAISIKPCSTQEFPHLLSQKSKCLLSSAVYGFNIFHGRKKTKDHKASNREVRIWQPVRVSPRCLSNKPLMCLPSPCAVSTDCTGFPQDSLQTQEEGPERMQLLNRPQTPLTALPLLINLPATFPSHLSRVRFPRHGLLFSALGWVISPLSCYSSAGTITFGWGHYHVSTAETRWPLPEKPGSLECFLVLTTQNKIFPGSGISRLTWFKCL